MKVINIDVKIQQAFSNLRRDRHVLLVAKTADGKILTGSKPEFYPPSITRLLGGGVDDGEDVEAAAIRELEEESGVRISADDIKPIARFDIRAVDAKGEVFNNQTYLFGADVGDATYKPADDVSQIFELSKDEMNNLADRFEELSLNLWYVGIEGDFSWHDYGKVYSVIHRVVADSMVG